MALNDQQRRRFEGLARVTAVILREMNDLGHLTQLRKELLDELDGQDVERIEVIKSKIAAFYRLVHKNNDYLAEHVQPFVEGATKEEYDYFWECFAKEPGADRFLPKASNQKPQV